MITRTQKQRMFDTNLPENKPYYVGGADSIIMLISVIAGGTGGFITFNGSADGKGFDTLQPANKDNFFTKIATHDLDTGKTYEGSIGISVASPKLLQLEVNSRFLNYLSVDTSMANGANINIDVVCIQN